MDCAPLALMVFLFGLSLPFAVLAYAAVDTAQRAQAKPDARPPVYFS